MSTQYNNSSVSLVTAVEALSEIADMELDREIGITDINFIEFQNKKIFYRTVHWINSKDHDRSIKLIKETFKNILNYLRNFYKKEYVQVTDIHTIEGIKTVMVLVGEAAKKLDKYTVMFHHAHAKSVTDLKEFHELQDFYLSKVARTVDEGLLGKWILALSQRNLAKKRTPAVALIGKKPIATKHVFIDLDSVKKDTEYELFFLKKEDGSRFFSPRLIRNIKLVCDFENYFKKEEVISDHLDVVVEWRDRFIQSSAAGLLKSVHNMIDRFYREGLIYRQNELVELLNKAIFALILSANPENQAKKDSIKTCSEYFVDFQKFLRQALQTRDYQKLLTNVPKKENIFGSCLLDVTHSLCNSLHTSMNGYEHLATSLRKLVSDSNVEDKLVSTEVNRVYQSLSQLLKKHPHGPLIKILDVLERGNYQFYDPYWLQNLPNVFYDFSIGGKPVYCIHCPSPTHQEFIHKAAVSEEFKGYIRSLEQGSKLLLFNVQDRTTWKEHFRCVALEELQNDSEFKNKLMVITLCQDSDFFNQLAPYHQDNQAETFFQQLKEQISDEKAGFVFPETLKSKMTDKWIDQLIHSIHLEYFDKKNVMTRETRMNFIQLFLLHLEWTIIQWVKPDYFSFSCKDGLDGGGTSQALFYAFLKIKSGEDIDMDKLNLMIHLPTLLFRERVIFPDKFNRLMNTLKLLETY